jgi:hypothetical protein
MIRFARMEVQVIVATDATHERHRSPLRDFVLVYALMTVATPSSALRSATASVKI